VCTVSEEEVAPYSGFIGLRLGEVEWIAVYVEDHVTAFECDACIEVCHGIIEEFDA
jgi:hypothetical protein